MSGLRRKRRRPPSPPYEGPAKQETREQVARVIAKHFDDPTVFVLPHYRALCAKTINRHVPKATFYGCDHFPLVVENTFAVDDHGKTVQMQKKKLSQYIRDNAGSLKFDAAFLDYKGHYAAKRQEIQEFASKMLKPTAVLAVTVQRYNLMNAAEVIEQDLRQVVETVVLEDSLEYDTSTAMICAIFLLQND